MPTAKKTLQENTGARSFLSRPVILIEDYQARCIVKTVEREYNPATRQWLTVAVARSAIRGIPSRYNISDWATRMKLADILQRLGCHTLPLNPDKAYGVPRWCAARGDVGQIVA